MKTSNTKPAAAGRKTPLLTIAIIGGLVLIALVWGGIVIFSKLNTKSAANYAEEVAKPLEAALVKAGAVKQCSRGDAGRGSDNDAPNYHTIYEVPGNRDAAANLVSVAAKDSGFTLTDDSSRANAGDNRLFADRISKRSPYADLSDGNVVLLVTEYGSKTYTGPGDQFCTVTKRDNPPADKTTVDITVNLPAFKR